MGLNNHRNIKWDPDLIHAFAEITGKHPNTIRNNVAFLSELIDYPLPQIHAPDPPIPYCSAHNIELKPSLLETKRCIEKNCPYLTYIVKIAKFER